MKEEQKKNERKSGKDRKRRRDRQEGGEKRPVESILVTDKMAVDACCKFVNDHRILVEPSCGK